VNAVIGTVVADRPGAVRLVLGGVPVDVPASFTATVWAVAGIARWQVHEPTDLVGAAGLLVEFRLGEEAGPS
jgi:hypothetical protein